MPAFAQRHVFGDRIILAVATAGGEGYQRRAPAVDHAPLGEIAHRLDREIDGAVDDAGAGAAVVRAAFIDHRQQFKRCGRTGLRVVAALPQRLPFGADVGHDAVPLVEDFTMRHRHRVQSERLGERAGWRRRCRFEGRKAHRRLGPRRLRAA